MAIEHKWIDAVDCSMCPCLNRGIDDYDCNLAYDILSLYSEEKSRIYVSIECCLESINYEGKVFKPIKVRAHYNKEDIK